MPPQLPLTSDVVRRVREETLRGEYNAAIGTITQLLTEPNDSGGSTGVAIAATPINATQRLRLHLLRADCLSGLRSHQRALEDGKAAIALSNALSPQAYFVTAREFYRLGKLKDALDHFDNAETLMSSGVGVTEIAPSDIELMSPIQDRSSNSSSTNADEAWAMIGVCPQDVPKGRPGPPPTAMNAAMLSLRETETASPAHRQQLVASYEWAQDLEQWRQYHAEARMLHQMTVTHVVPARMATQAINFVNKESFSSNNANRTSQVVVIRNNMTKSVMRLASQALDDCAIVEPFGFPQTIKPGEVAIAVVAGTGWTSGSKGLVAYTIEMAAMVGYHFEAPIMSDFMAATWLRAGRGGSESQRAADFGNLKPKTRPTASDDILVGGTRLKSIVSQVSRVVTFSMVEVQPVALSVSELVGVLEFLPATVLRKCTAVSWHLRDCISHLPPPLLGTPPVTAPGVAASSAGGSAASSPWFPNYLFPNDFVNNPWIVRDPADVTWLIAFDGLVRDFEDYSVHDMFDNRVLTVTMDLQNKGFSATAYYGGGKRRQQVTKISESWNPFSKSVSWKLNNGRKLGSVSVGSSEVLLVPDGSEEPVLALRKMPTVAGGQKGGSTSPKLSTGGTTVPGVTVVRLPENTVVAEVRFRRVALSTTKRGDIVADVVMKPGCDGFLTGVLAVYARTKWCAQ